jgi:hypothetical protein
MYGLGVVGGLIILWHCKTPTLEIGRNKEKYTEWFRDSSGHFMRRNEGLRRGVIACIEKHGLYAIPCLVACSDILR